MPTVFEADLPTLASMSPEYQDDPHLLNREALAQGPIAMGPFGPEVLGYDAVQTVLRDRRFQMPPGLGLEMQGITSGPVWDRAVSGILSLNGADHTRLRKLVARAFTPRAAERLRAKMVEVIDELVEPATAIGACDVVADIARSYPIPIICELLGAPRDDWERLSTWTDDAFKIFNFNVVNDAPDILRAFDELDAYIEAMVDERRHALRDDLLSELIRAEDHGDRLTHDELKMLAVAVLTAGTDTTRNQLAAAVEVFCAHPEQWDRLMREPALALQAVDEVMRYAPVIFGTMRVAVEDVELCDVIIPAGTLVGATTAAANRDPAVFVDPDTFDITRQESAPMLTFGGGVHYCLGVHLAKAELAEALTLMARRMPRLRQTGPAPWKPVFGISGPLSLPVVFEPGH
jgi:cytochrome P450